MNWGLDVSDDASLKAGFLFPTSAGLRFIGKMIYALIPFHLLKRKRKYQQTTSLRFY